MRPRIMLSTLSAVCILALGAAYLPAASSQATIFRINGVIWFDGNGTALFVPDSDVQVVVTGNSRGNINVRGHGTLPDGAALPDQAMHWDNTNTGFICGFGGTTEFSGVTTPSGRFSFTCKAP